MFRLAAILLLAAAGLFGATIKLYLKDGTYHLIREYRLQGDRVRYYSTERGEWEEIPAELVDLKRTEREKIETAEREQQLAAEITAEDAAERAEREEREKVPMETGVYFGAGSELKSLKQAESKVVTNKGRSILKIFSPVPIVSGKATVELEGEHSATIIPAGRPEFYVRLAAEERFGIAKLAPKKGARVVQKWTIVPVSKEMIEEQADVDIFRRQLADALFKIWPEKPLEPGEYAVYEYTAGKANIQIWDFSVRP